MKLKGKLLLIGGAEEKGTSEDSIYDLHHGILERLIVESKKKTSSRIEVLTAASTVPEDSGKDYIKVFKKLEAENVGVLTIKERAEADLPKNLKRLEQADVLFVTGGDQLRLTAIMGGTAFFEMLSNKLQTDKDFIYAGTSAGTAVVGANMVFEGASDRALNKGEVKTTSGFGFLSNIVFDTHFIRRGRIGRLFQILITNPKLLGVGLEENTGLLIADGKMEGIGPGMTVIVDGKNVKQTNLLDVRDGAPLTIENLTLHVINKADVYDLKTGDIKIVTPDEYKI